jgi:hypothetical protein
METLNKFNLLSVIIFLVMGVLHLITPLFYGFTQFGTGMFFFGIIYTTLGILIHQKRENKTVGFLSILSPLIGMILAVISLLNAFNLYLFCVCIGLDPIIIVLRIYIYRQL